MGRLWRDYSLSIVLTILFALSLGLQTLAGWFPYASDQRAQGQTPALFGADGYVWDWLQAVMENWQSEFLQLLTFVVLTTFLIHKGSHESKDTDEAMQAQLDRIERALERLEKR